MSDLYGERIEAVRQRFGAKLDARIAGIETAVPQAGCEVDVDVLAKAHRHAHDLCGVGPTLGYAGTARAARSIEQMLLAAVKAERVLTDNEIPRLREGIALLRSVASAEIGSAEHSGNWR